MLGDLKLLGRLAQLEAIDPVMLLFAFKQEATATNHEWSFYWVGVHGQARKLCLLEKNCDLQGMVEHGCSNSWARNVVVVTWFGSGVHHGFLVIVMLSCVLTRHWTCSQSRGHCWNQFQITCPLSIVWVDNIGPLLFAWPTCVRLVVEDVCPWGKILAWLQVAFGCTIVHQSSCCSVGL